MLAFLKKELLLCHFAKNLSLTPDSFSESEFVSTLKTFGFSDNAILDATLVVPYFNFVNRMVLGLGINLEHNLAKGYTY